MAGPPKSNFLHINFKLCRIKRTEIFLDSLMIIKRKWYLSEDICPIDLIL